MTHVLCPPTHREGTDIYSDIKVNYIDAILGTKIKVSGCVGR